MAAAMVVSSIPKAEGMEIVEQACTAQSISVVNDVSLYGLFIYFTTGHMLLVALVLRLVLKREFEIRIVYPQQHVVQKDANLLDVRSRLVVLLSNLL